MVKKIDFFSRGNDFLRHHFLRRFAAGKHSLDYIGCSSNFVLLFLLFQGCTSLKALFPSKNNFVKALRKLHPEITTIILNVNDQKTSMVLGERETVLYGKGYIEDDLCGHTFRISSKSFYQVNPVQTEKLYAKAIELAGLTGKERVIDAYCGIGTIGLIASDKAKEVVSVELNPDAVKDAIVNAKRNGIKNVRFYRNDASVFMRQMKAKVWMLYSWIRHAAEVTRSFCPL